MKQKNLFIAGAGLLVLALVIGAFFYQNQNAEQSAQTAAENQLALNRPNVPSFGNPDAPVHIVEFLDPACGTCRDFYPRVKNLMAAHPGKVRLSIRYAPFHPGSEPVVKVLEAAKRHGQFEPTLEALFASQSVWVQNHTAQVDLIWSQLSGLGLDIERLKYDMNSPAIAQVIARDLADAKTLNVAQTPEYFVNGKPLPSFGFDQLKQLVEDAVQSATPK